MPGKPRKYLFFLNIPNVVGLPGFIEILFILIFKFLFFNAILIKSYLPTEIPPDEIKQSKSLSASYFFKISISLSLTYFISVTSPPNIFIKFFNVCVFDELIVPFGFCMFFISSPVIKIANLGFVKTLIFFIPLNHQNSKAGIKCITSSSI